MNELSDVRPADSSFPPFLNDSACGVLIAAKDWSDTLGPLDSWPQSLRTATALLLRSPVPMVMLWGHEGIMLYNDAYSVFAGRRHPELLGSKVREGWAEVADFNDNVMRVGLAGGTLQYRDQELTLHRNGGPEQVWMNLDYSPVVDESGEPAGVLAIVVETTERVLAERSMRESEERLRFLDKLAEATRELSDPYAIMGVTARVLGEQLGVANCAYADMEPDEDNFTIRGDWAESGFKSIVGTYSLAAFGDTADRELHAGRPLITRDTLKELGPEEGAGLLSLGLGATVCMPFIKDGKLTALMAAHSSGPRNWTDAELRLIRETTDRSWAHIERTRSQSALRESEERLRLAADAARIGTWDLDITSSKGRWDEVALRIGGVAQSAYTLENWTLLIHPDDRESIGQQFVSSLAPGGPPYDVVFRAAAPANDGGHRWLASHGAVFRNERGEALRAIGIVRDITQQKRAEQALRDSEQRFRNVADSAPMMIWVTEADGRCTYLNQRWYEFTGQAPETGEGYGWLNAVHPEDRPRAEAEFVAANADHRDYSTEFRLRRADGVYRWTLDAAAARFATDGTFLGYVGSVMDIDERREFEQNLIVKEEQLRLALEAGEVGLWDVDPLHDTLYWPPRVKAMFGIAADVPVTIQDFYEGVHPEDREATAAAYAAAGNPNLRTHYDVEYRTVGKEDGVIRWVAAKGRGIFDESGTCVRMIGTAVDITARKKAEQHQRLLIDELSHRAKNLLAIVQSVALQSFRGSETLEQMRASFEGRLGALGAAHDILTRQQWEAAPLSELIGATLGAVSPGDGRILLDGPDLLLPPKTGVSLAMAVHELATNALKYGSLQVPEGKVSVTWRVSGGRLNLRWTELGGPPVQPPSRRGFGTRMIERGLAAELGGSVRMSFEPSGVICVVDAPLPQVAQ